MFRPNKLKQLIAGGGRAYGTWLFSAVPTFAEIASHCDYDFLVFDNEHGPGDLFSTIDMLRAAQASEVTCMVRASSHDPALLARMVDSGVDTFLVPMVNTAAEAKAVVDACLYPPDGKKGFAAGAVRASGYGISSEYIAEANKNIFIAVQIESVEAVENVSEIAAVPGVDMIFIGPNDLSGSLGLLAQTDHPVVIESIQKAFDAAQAAGKPVGSIPLKGQTFKDSFNNGYKLIIDGADVAFYRMGMQNAVASYREWSKSN